MAQNAKAPAHLVKDAEGKAVNGVPVSFGVLTGGGYTDKGWALTDASGPSRQRHLAIIWPW